MTRTNILLIEVQRRRAAARGKTSRLDALAARAEPVMSALPPVWFGLLGPVLIGTFWAALVGPVIGLSKRDTIVGLLFGVLIWSVVLTLGFDLLVEWFGTT